MWTYELPPLQEDERIYLNVPYKLKDFAKRLHCSYDPEKRLWFTGSLNPNLPSLVKLYGVNDATSENARRLLESKLNEKDITN